jgi:integrase
VALANYLRRRGATYSVRVPVPQDLQAQVGKREITKALGKVRDPAEAKRKGAERVQEIRAWFDRLRSGAKLTSGMIERECQDIAREALEFLKVWRLGRAPQRSTATDDGYDEDDPHIVGLDVAFDQFVEAIGEDNFRPVTAQAAEIVARLGVSAPKDSPEWNELCRALLRTHLEVYRVELKRVRGDELATAKTPLNPMLADAFQDGGAIIARGHAGLTSPAPLRVDRARQDGGAIIAPSRGRKTEDGEWSLEEACDRFIAAHVNGASNLNGSMQRDAAWTPKTEAQHRATLDMFKRWAEPGTPLSEIDRRTVGDFKALIERLPTMHGKRAADKDRSLQSIVEEAERAGEERLSPTTIQRHLSALIGLFRYAKEHGRYTADNPASGFRFPRTRRPRDERPAWTPKQLEALFQSPIWMEPEILDHRYFLPLLGAYGGLRLEEACQLHVEDVRTEDGITFLDIRPGDGKQLKSRAAKRRVPVHPVVITAGFLRHVEGARRKGSTLVFPELEGRRGGPDKRFGAAVTKEFTAYRRAIGQYEPGRDLHALRHSFTTGLEDAGVSRQFIDELTGHEGTGETSRYAKGASLKVLAEAVSRLDYGFDTAHLIA